MYQAHTLENIFRFILISKLNIKRSRENRILYIFFFLFFFFTTIGTHRPPHEWIVCLTISTIINDPRGEEIIIKNDFRSFMLKHLNTELCVERIRTNWWLTIIDIDSAYNIFWWNFIGKDIAFNNSFDFPPYNFLYKYFYLYIYLYLYLYLNIHIDMYIYIVN